MKIEEIIECYGINCVDEVFNMAKNWENKTNLISHLKNTQCHWDAECLEMLIKYNFLNVVRW